MLVLHQDILCYGSYCFLGRWAIYVCFLDDLMRICAVCTGFCSIYGGLESVYKKLGEKWGDKGHQVFVISGFGSVPYPIQLRILKVPFVPRKAFEIVRALSRISRFESSELEGLSCAPFVALELAVLKPDIVLSNTAYEALVPLKMGLPCVMVSEANIRSRIGVFEKADRVIVNDERSFQTLKEIGINTQLIMNGVEISASQVDVKSLRARYSVPEGSIVILTVARLYLRKRIDLLIRAFSHLKQPAMLLIVGDGPEFSSLQRLAANHSGRVVFLRNVSERELNDLFNLCDVFSLPSSAEGMPMALLEALAHGKVVVSNSTPEKMSVLGEFGVFTNVEDPVEYSESLLRAVNMKIDVSSLEYRAHMRKFDWDSIALQYIEVFNRVLLERGRVRGQSLAN
jgi:glycosyltransferase involved in cell wall biosynthesis